ncbi:MAG: hypothetical protein QHD01_31995 [Bradyrhizobium sp.]|uniref:hypothetical protein n=1 Tax=Bradyrhizobium sp. TaxID=376 RepID=UPI0029A7B3EA|nr:hypothetical protein [Bradyrhizobium sp.]MDX3971193.1 hypothetical protein [Bradyrhizobium sp.]
MMSAMGKKLLQAAKEGRAIAAAAEKCDAPAPMTNTIEMLATKQTALTWRPGDGPRFPAPSPGSEIAVLELPRGPAAAMVAESMNDKAPIEIDGRWFDVQSAAVEMGGSVRFWLRPIETR